MHDGEAHGGSVVTEFGALGGEVVAIVVINPGESDYSAALTEVADADPEAIYYGGYSAEAIVLVNQLGLAGLEGVVFFGCDGTFGQDFLDGTGDAGEGAYGTALIPPLA
jgi:branched-chain amino acid transport system substrate-binding protein